MNLKLAIVTRAVLRRAVYLLCAANLLLGAISSSGARAAQPSSTTAPNPAWSVYAKPQRLVRLTDGRGINIYCIGHRSPTVVLDAGLGDSAVIWRKVHSRLAERSQVCAFDRTDYNFNNPGPLPRDAAHIAQDMKAMFEAAKQKPPYVLVGHSLGGLNVRY